MRVIERLVLFNKKYLLLFFFIFLIGKNFAQVYPDQSVHQMLKTGINFIIDQKYDEAEELFKQLDKTHNEIPFGKIYLAAVAITKSYDYAQPYNDKLITNYLESAKLISERLLKQDEKDIWNNYFYALTEGYLAYYDALNKNWLSAFSTGLSSVSAYEDCLELDKDFYEALVAIGSYKYWKSSKTEFLNWLPFIDDEKALGIKYLQKAIKHSGYNSHLAIHSLAWIYIEQEDYKSAIKLAESALKEYPDSRIYNWVLARSYEDIDVLKSISLYRKILESYPKDLRSNKVNEVRLKHLIAQQLVKINKRNEALTLCDEILSIKDYTEFEQEKLENRLERVKTLRKELSVQ